MGSSYHTMVANIGKASTCRTHKTYTEEKTKREEREVAIMAELADKGGGVEPVFTRAK
jgi:hypothetical protein